MRAWVALAFLASGCYLSHERTEPPAMLPEPVVPPRCEPRALEELFSPVFAGGNSGVIAMAAASCDVVFAARVNPEPAWSGSEDSGLSFPTLSPFDGVVEDPTIVANRSGGAHLVYEGDGVVFHHAAASDFSLGPAERLGGEGEAVLATGPLSRPLHLVDVARDGSVAVVWSEPRFAALHVSVRDPAGAVRLVTIDTASAGTEVREARLCYAGAHLVVIWERVPSDGYGEVWGAVWDGRGDPSPTRIGDSRAADMSGAGLDVACNDDGRAIAAWAASDGLYTPPGGIGIAAADADGFAPRPMITVGSGRRVSPYYPMLAAGASRVLLTFQDHGLGSYAILDWEGRGPEAQPILFDPPEAVRRIGLSTVCGHRERDDFFFVLTENNFSSLDGMHEWAVQIDPSGALARHTLLGEGMAYIGHPTTTCSARGVLLVQSADRMRGWAPPPL